MVLFEHLKNGKSKRKGLKVGGSIDHSVFLRNFSPSDLTSVYDLACSTLSERYDPLIFNDLSISWPQGFMVIDGPWGINAFILGVMPSPVHSRVLMLAVKPEAQRRGLGTQLMQRFLQESRIKGARVVSLEVRKGNIEAIRFYKRLGFRIFNEIKEYYNDGEDAYQMQCFL